MLLLLVCWGTLVSAQANYGKTVIVCSEKENAAVQDLQNTLTGYRAGTITIQKVPLENRTGQSFYLSIKGSQTLIKYTVENSLENAIYTYLDMLGFRWYGPGDNWFVKPKTIQRTDFAGRWIEPSFRNRNFFGTGGLDFGKLQNYDSTNQFKAKWLAWMRRNRFNMDFGGVGHTGQAFYLQNKSLLEKHPGWFVNQRGEQSGRIKIDSPAAVNAYKNWVSNNFKKANTPFITLGVDPEDGRGGPDDPLPKKMPGINNYADKWWWLANEVAKDYQQDKNVVISMYAYGDGTENAKVPSFRLRDNVYPVIIPYAFQQAYLPNQMIKTWAKAIDGAMGIYDYWNITQWSKDVPQFDLYSIPSKFKFWNANKINGVYLESTDAAGPMGHALWLTGQLLWNKNRNFDSLYKQYLGDCFGKAAPYMKNMFDRWSNNYQGSADVSFSMQDLKNASSAVKKSSPEWKRINELKAYLHYLKMYYALDGTQQAKDSLFRYLYSIHHLLMVQTAAFVGQYYIPPLDKGNLVPPPTEVKKLSEAAIENQFNEDLNNTPPPYALSGFVFDFDKVKYAEPIPALSWRFGGFQCNFFFKAPFTGKITLGAGAETNTPFRLYTDQQVIVEDSVGVKNFDYTTTLEGRVWKMKTYTVDIIKGTTYYLHTSYGFSRIEIQTPGIVLFKNPGGLDFDNYQYPVQYFYVPKSATEIVFTDAHPEGTNDRGYMIAPDGTRLKRQPTGFADIYQVPVAPRYRGKIWTADFGEPSWSLKNMPNITSLQKFDYIEK